MNSAFRARWLASSEVISQVLFTSEQPKKNKMASCFASVSQEKIHSMNRDPGHYFSPSALFTLWCFLLYPLHTKSFFVNGFKLLKTICSCQLYKKTRTNFALRFSLLLASWRVIGTKTLSGFVSQYVEIFSCKSWVTTKIRQDKLGPIRKTDLNCPATKPNKAPRRCANRRF